MASTAMEADTVAQFGVEVIGRTDELVEEFLPYPRSDASPTPAWRPLLLEVIFSSNRIKVRFFV